MHVIVPIRNGQDAGSRVVRLVRQSRGRKCCLLIAAYNILVLGGDDSGKKAITIDSSKYTIMEDEMVGAIKEHLKNIADGIRYTVYISLIHGVIIMTNLSKYIIMDNVILEAIQRHSTEIDDVRKST